VMRFIELRGGYHEEERDYEGGSAYEMMTINRDLKLSWRLEIGD
jgi:hypothetical protein